MKMSSARAFIRCRRERGGLADVAVGGLLKPAYARGARRIVEALGTRKVSRPASGRKLSRALSKPATPPWPRVGILSATAGCKSPAHKVDDQGRYQIDHQGHPFTSKAPRGWESPASPRPMRRWISCRPGIEYVADWCLDDEPRHPEDAGQVHVSVPCARDQRCRRARRAAAFIGRALQAGRGPVRPALSGRRQDPACDDAISVHAYLTGAPHRIKYLEMLYDHILGHKDVVMWTGAGRCWIGIRRRRGPTNRSSPAHPGDRYPRAPVLAERWIAHQRAMTVRFDPRLRHPVNRLRHPPAVIRPTFTMSRRDNMEELP